MDKLKIGLLALIALLLLMFLIDRNREPAQMKAFIDKMEQSQRDLTAQQAELRDVIAELKENGVAVAASNGQTAAPKPTADLDFHFVSLVEVGGRLYELDGNNDGPVDCGTVRQPRP